MSYRILALKAIQRLRRLIMLYAIIYVTALRHIIDAYAFDTLFQLLRCR